MTVDELLLELTRIKDEYGGGFTLRMEIQDLVFPGINIAISEVDVLEHLEEVLLS